MDYKAFLRALGFLPKENASGILQKKYADGHVVFIDLEKEIIDYGEKIKAESKTTQNFSQPENFVVLECVNRLLEKGYKPQNIILEKTYPAGHGFSGRLDICVTREDGSEYLIIECKTYGKEFDKAFARVKKDGGQLFTYFKFSNKPDIIMLYASEVKGHDIAYRNEIIKIEDDYRTGDVKDFYEKWNKLSKDNGVFDAWVKPYNFESKALTPKQLKPIREEDSSLIFNQFLEILRHNVVSDKPNAFNKMFTLFLCKVYDEKTTKPNEELKFQWLEGIDITIGENAYIDFLIRLSDLYKSGMLEFLEKEITDFSEDDFNKKYGSLDESIKKDLLKEFKKIRLEKNNEFAIKEVFDNQSFLENSKIVKEVVELLQGYRLRYNKRQQYLSDFFELLLTTGLKQESGQFFTSVPIAQFILKSLPIDIFVNKKLEKGERNNLLPYIIDYAAGSGHFITEGMHEIQELINKKNPDNFISDTAKKIKSWQGDHFDWATQYIYGIEKDYRLVKVGKVGCYLHGDGLANVILSDGLANFENTKEYKDLLKHSNADFPKENKQFDILVSNPPYSVSAFKNNAEKFYGEKDFELYNSLTANSSEIECLFVERMKQLLKDDGVAGIILPSSILSNEGVYTKAREIILKYFKIIAIAKLGSNTFMATGTNTVVLFLRRRNNYDSINLQKSIGRFFEDWQDVTRNGIEKPIAKYVNHVWENIGFDDYVSLLKKEPNNTVAGHEIYKEYRKKLKAKTEKDFWNTLIETEKEKLLYFILAYPQRVVLVKTGEKEAEKRFLGYEFSNRRGSEGIHPIRRGKTIEECTRLFNENDFEDKTKASIYIYKAFNGDYDFPIHESLKENISHIRLVDMLTFDRAGFAKNISIAVKKKIKIESKWEQKSLENICEFIGKGQRPAAFADAQGGFPFIISSFLQKKCREADFDIEALIIGDGGSANVHYINGLFSASDHTYVLKQKSNVVNLKYIYNVLLNNLFLIENGFMGSGLKNVSKNHLQNIKIPLPPLDIQQKIVTEIDVLEKQEVDAKEKIDKLKDEIEIIVNKINGEHKKLRELCRYSDKRVDSKLLTSKNYIGVDNMLQNMMGKIDSNFVPTTGTSTEYEIGNILLSNIRPYLKKIWYANNTGGSSNDVLVLQKTVENIDSKYVFYNLKQDKFFDYEMLATKGVKMPRGDKQHILDYKIPVTPLSEQQKIVSEIEKIEAQIDEQQKTAEDMPGLKKDVLKKYGIY